MAAAFVAGIWSVIFGLPSAKVKGFYLILTTMAAQFITVDFIITQYVAQIGGRGQAFSLPPGTIKIGPWIIDSDIKVYYLMCVPGDSMHHRRGQPPSVQGGTRLGGHSGQRHRGRGHGHQHRRVQAVSPSSWPDLSAGSPDAFWISNLAAISPEHFPWFLSLWLVGVILIGGAGSIHGVIFGSIFMVVVMELLSLGGHVHGRYLSQNFS